MISQTSLLAWKNLNNLINDTSPKTLLGVRQLQVLSFLKTHDSKSFSNTEISEYLQLPINNITPRVYELRRKGFLVQDGIRYCYVTGRLVKVWRIKL